MQTRFGQFAAVEKLTAVLQSIKDNAGRARKGWKERNAALWLSVYEETHKQLTALRPPVEPSNVTELALAQKEAK